MKFSVINRAQNSLFKMTIPFQIYFFYEGDYALIITYYAMALGLSGLVVFGFPIKINQIIANKELVSKLNIIYFIYLILSTVVLFSFVSVIFNKEILIFIVAGLYFSMNHMQVSFEKFFQFYNLDNKAVCVFGLYNIFQFFLILCMCIAGVEAIYFFNCLFFINTLFVVYLFLKFFDKFYIELIDLKKFFKGSIILGQYSFLNNMFTRFDSIVLPILFNPRAFSIYFLTTRFLDIGIFLISMYSQLNLVQIFKINRVPKLFPYLIVGFVAMVISLSAFILFNFIKNYEILQIMYIGFLVIFLRSFIVFYQDKYIFFGRELILTYMSYFNIFALSGSLLVFNYLFQFDNVFYYFFFLISVLFINVLMYRLLDLFYLKGNCDEYY